MNTTNGGDRVTVRAAGGATTLDAVREAGSARDAGPSGVAGLQPPGVPRSD